MGANPYDPLYSFENVKDLKDRADYVIVLYHGGYEQYKYPSPELRRVFRRFAEVGADCIIAQHTHCIGCIERYLDSILIYGQGNFWFDYSENDCWKTSILIKLSFDSQLYGNKAKMEVIPCQKVENSVRLAKEDIAKDILSKLNSRSMEILRDGFVEKSMKNMRN